jgi:diguanylate cyclase (GGDEF)-like protein
MLLSGVSAARGQSGGVPVFTTARAAHQLTIEQAARAFPVRLRGVVTYYDPYIDPRRPAFFVSDASGAIFIALSTLPPSPFKAGDLVEVDGVTGAGDFAPIIDRATARAIGSAPLPDYAPRVSMSELLTGSQDGQWVELEGVVRSVLDSGRNVVLTLSLEDGDIAATTVREAGVDYESLVDARILLRGNTGPVFNHRRQMTGAHLLFPGVDTMKIEEPAPARPFDASVVPAVSLLRFTPNQAFLHRVHLRGSVTLFWPGRALCLQDGSQGLCAQTAQTARLNYGQEADIVGFPATGEFTPTLVNAIFRGRDRSAEGNHGIAALPVTADQAFSGEHDAQLVELQGQLIGEDRAADDPSIVVRAGNRIFSAVLPRTLLPSGTRTLSGWESGSWLKLIGICSVHSAPGGSVVREGFSVPASFRIMLRSTADVVVLRMPSWWNAAHSLEVLAVALFGILLTAVALLRQVRRGRRITAELRLEMGERRRAEEATRCALQQMEHQAHHDPLTGLANRLMFDTAIRAALASADRKGTRVGLLYLDLDRFKVINDSLGHAAGDILLREAAERLSKVSPSESLLARLGGDEFALLLPDIEGKSDAEAAALGVVRSLGEPFLIEGLPWHCPASVGLSLFPDDAQSAMVLQKNADAALYRAKRTARGQVVAFDRLMCERAARSAQVETALRRGLEKGGFSLVYQPQYWVRGGLYGFEASLRLRDRILGQIGPAEFVEVAEESGLIGSVGEWALRAACRQWAAWVSEGRPPVCMAVNLSPAQIGLPDFPALVRTVLDETAMPPEWLELELTESGILAGGDLSLAELKTIGVRISADEFGTGFSSLNSLSRSVIDCIKIDRSFVRDASSTPGTLPFIRTIVSLAHSLGMKTVAEGVETQDQKAAVVSAGCDILQGYLLSEPLPGEEAAKLLGRPVPGADRVADEALVGVA